MSLIDDIKNKIGQFGSDVANGTTDAFDAAKSGVESVFGTNSSPNVQAAKPLAALPQQATVAGRPLTGLQIANSNPQTPLGVQTPSPIQPKPIQKPTPNYPIANAVGKQIQKNVISPTVDTVRQLLTSPAAHDVKALSDLISGNTKGAKSTASQGNKQAQQQAAKAFKNPSSLVAPEGLEEAPDEVPLNIKATHFDNVLNKVKAGQAPNPIEALRGPTEQDVANIHLHNPMAIQEPTSGGEPLPPAPNGEGLSPRGQTPSRPESSQTSPAGTTIEATEPKGSTGRSSSDNPSSRSSLTQNEGNVNPFRNPEAERAAIEDYEKNRDIASAARAYQAVDQGSLTNALSNTAQALRESGALPEEGSSPYGIKPIAGISDEEAAKGGVTAKEPDRAKVLSPGRRLDRLGPAGRKLHQLFKNTEFNEDRINAAMERETPTFNKLSKEDQATAAKVVRGEEKTDDPDINKAADELRQHFLNVRQSAAQAGVKVGNRGLTYVPQMLERSFLDKTANFNRAVKNLVDTGKAKDEADAVAQITRVRDSLHSTPRRFGNLELPRKFDNPDPDFDIDKLRSYNQRAAARISEAQHYGPDNEVINQLKAEAGKNGEDVTALNGIVDGYLHPPEGAQGTAGRAVAGVRHVTNVLQLPKAAISHVGQGILNTASDVGYTKYFKSLGNRIFNSEEKSFIDRAGTNVEKNEKSTVLGRVTAPGLRQLRQFHREVATLAGKYNADALAKAGKEDDLRRIGVTGDLEKAGKGFKLTEEQEMQAGRAESDKSIFSDSSLQIPRFLQSDFGKVIGQYRSAFQTKESGYMINLVKEARRGNVAPLLRFVALGAPVAGTLVTLGKNTYTGGTPIKKNETPKQFASQVFTNSGVGSLGGGAVDSAVNYAQHNYSNDERVQNTLSAIAPLGGTAAETAQNADNAIRGNPEGLVKEGTSLIPAPVVGSKISNKLYPTKVITPAQQTYNTAYDKAVTQAEKSMSPSFSQSADPVVVKQNAKLRSDFASLLARNHTSSGQSIQLSPQDSKAQAASLAADPQLLSEWQKFNKSLPDHDPKFDLTPAQLKTYEQYESEAPGEQSRTALEQKNTWLPAEFNKIATWETKQVQDGNSVKSPDFVAYPDISTSQQSSMNQLTALSAIPEAQRTTAQISQLSALENSPDLQQAFNSIDNYTNAVRAKDGYAAIPYPAQLTPEEQSFYNQYNALPKSTGARTQLINSNPDLWNSIETTLAQSTLFNVEKQGALAYEGGTPTDTFLGGIANLGNYDIASSKNANGTTDYSLDPAAAYAQQQAASQSQNKPLVPLPKYPKKHVVKVRAIKKVRSRKIKSSKTQRVHVQSNGVLHPIQIGKSGGPLRIKV